MAIRIYTVTNQKKQFYSKSVKSLCYRRSSRLGRSRRFKLSVYDTFLRVYSLFVNLRWTFSMKSISCLQCREESK